MAERKEIGEGGKGGIGERERERERERRRGGGNGAVGGRKKGRDGGAEGEGMEVGGVKEKDQYAANLN